jgi:hypothetical protein
MYDFTSCEKLSDLYYGKNRSRIFENRVKVKVKFSLCFLTEHSAMKAYWGVEV